MAPLAVRVTKISVAVRVLKIFAPNFQNVCRNEFATVWESFISIFDVLTKL